MVESAEESCAQRDQLQVNRHQTAQASEPVDLRRERRRAACGVVMPRVGPLAVVLLVHRYVSLITSQTDPNELAMVLLIQRDLS